MNLRHTAALIFSALIALCGGCATSSTHGQSVPPTTPFATPSPDAQWLDGGVARKVLRPGTGTFQPDAGSIVRIEFTGFRADGTEFDSSRSKGKPQIYELPKVVRGLSEAIQQMVVGECSRFWIPAALAYGDAPEDARLPAGPLVFDIELLNIVRR